MTRGFFEDYTAGDFCIIGFLVGICIVNGLIWTDQEDGNVKLNEKLEAIERNIVKIERSLDVKTNKND